jgi:hypothetical protein
LFSDIRSQAPVHPKHGGHIAVTDWKLIPQSEGGVYTAGGNIGWVSPYWCPGNIPLIHSAINSLVAGKFKEPKPLVLTVLVCSKADPRVERHRQQALLRRISPEEEHIAYILATWRDVSEEVNMEDLLTD